LLATFRELAFQMAFRDVLGRLEVHAGPLLLLSPRREAHERLLALLCHDLAVGDRLAEVPADHWILSGELMGFTPPGPAIWLPAPTGGMAGFGFAIAPAEALLSQSDWEALMPTFVAIGAEVDAWRLPATGLEDASYAAALARFAERSFMTCGEGAWVIAERLGALAAGVRESGRPWFVYEDYDARYTNFLRTLVAEDAAPDDLPHRWREAGLPLDEPFAPAALGALAQPFQSRGSR
jgi:hypothetical protein